LILKEMKFTLSSGIKAQIMEEFMNINIKKVFRRCNLSTFGEVSSVKKIINGKPILSQDGIGSPTS
jgi:hypothetical protein